MATLGLRIYQKIDPQAQFSILLENKKNKTSLLFQGGTVAELSQPETDGIRSDHYTRVTDSYGCLGVLQICPRENTEYYLIVVTRCVKVCVLLGNGVYKIQEVDIISLQEQRPSGYKHQDEDGWIKEMKKVLGSESFYFSQLGGDSPLDLTLCAQRRAKTNVSDNKFFWNRMLHLHPKRFNVDCSSWLIKVMCGSVEFSTIYMNNHSPKIYIISRLSCERAGTRFMMRGVDDSGNVANFVETEQLVHIESLNDLILSYIQTRGTVPLFWEQPGVNVGSHKVKMSREPSISSGAFDLHMKFLRQFYGRQVVINLLGTGVTGKSQGEAALSHLFQLQHNSCPWSADCPHIVFDFHQECKGGNTDNLARKLQPQIQKEIDEFGFFWSDREGVKKCQTGSIRSNCLDCLDRTNRVQTFLGVQLIPKLLLTMGSAAVGGVAAQRFQSKLEDMWKDNGNKISQIYAGTGALQGSKLIDGARSVGRTIQNNLLDSNKQEAIDSLLHGNLLNNYLNALSRTVLPLHLLYAPLPVLKAMCDRTPEFSASIPLKISVGTYNVNGGKHFRSLAYKHLSLDDWLLDSKKNDLANSLVNTAAPDDVVEKPPDLFAIGFEEIVDLNASNIVSNTQWSENANSWGHELQKVISRDEEFVMVTWAQLVGVALFVFVNARHAQHVKNVSVKTVKTGMQGNTGNKGGVGIRLVVRNTSVAFVCSHFAAGQKEVNDRNQDYDAIARKMIFNMVLYLMNRLRLKKRVKTQPSYPGMPLWSHDYVFWCGDFNYRINLPREQVLDLVERREWGQLLEQDQLLLSQKENKCFKGFLEGTIEFAPTYKYDLFSDDYDTSEKARVPAWTDRVLFWRRRYEWDKGNHWHPGSIVHYGSAGLKQSDHRPVLATIEVEGRVVREDTVNRIYREVVSSLGPSDCTVIVEVLSGDLHMSDEVVESVQESLSVAGNLVTVRFAGESMLFAFDSPMTALKAVKQSPLTVGETVVSVRLKTEAWQQQLEEELALCSTSSTPLTDETHSPPARAVSSSSLAVKPEAVRGPSKAAYRLSDVLSRSVGLNSPSTFYTPSLGATSTNVLGQLYSAEGLTPSPFPSPCPSPSHENKPLPARPLMPARPPPPRPTPPSSTPGSPSLSRHRSNQQSPLDETVAAPRSAPPVRSAPLPPSKKSIDSMSSSSDSTPPSPIHISRGNGVNSQLEESFTAPPQSNAPPPLLPSSNAPPPLLPTSNAPPPLPNAHPSLPPPSNAFPSLPPPSNAPPSLPPKSNAPPSLPPPSNAPPSLPPPSNAPPSLPPPSNTPPSLPPPSNAPPSLPPRALPQVPARGVPPLLPARTTGPPPALPPRR